MLNALLQIATAAHQRVPNRTRFALPFAYHQTQSPLPECTVDRIVSRPLAWESIYRKLITSVVSEACAQGWHADGLRLWELTSVPSSRDGVAITETLRDAAQTAGEEVLMYRAEYIRATILIYHSLDEATASFARCVKGFDRLGCCRELGYTLTRLAYCHDQLGHYELVMAAATQALDIARHIGDGHLEHIALAEVGQALARDGRFEEARDMLESALRKAKRLHDAIGLRTLLSRMSAVALAAGDHERAWSCATEWLAVQSESESPLKFALAKLAAARAALGLNRTAAAMVEIADAARILADLGNRAGQAQAAHELGRAYLRCGDDLTAAVLLTRAADELHDVGAVAASAEIRLQLTKISEVDRKAAEAEELARDTHISHG